MARTLITEEARITLAEPADKTLNEDIVVKQVENQSEDDECHVAFDCEILDGETHEEATDKEVIDYIKGAYDYMTVPEDDDLHLELWTQASTEEEIKRDIKNYIEGHFDAYSLYVPEESIKIIHAELWRFVDYDELNGHAAEILFNQMKEKGVTGIDYTSEKPDGFSFETEEGVFWFQAETAEVKKLGEALTESHLHEEKYSEPAFAAIESALEDAGFEFTRFNEAGILTKNLGWVVTVEGKEVYLSCDGTWLDESKKIDESHGKGFVEKYKGFSIHDVGDKYVITDESGATVEETKWGLPICRAIIDELAEKKAVKEDLPDAQPAEPIVVDTLPEPDEDIKKNAIISQLNILVQKEFESIDAVNGLLGILNVDLPEMDLEKPLNNIITNHSFNVGIIQGIIEKLNPAQSKSVEDGKASVEADTEVGKTEGE